MKATEFMMMPGPTEIPPRVLKALLHPATAPGDPDFIAVCDETSARLQTVLGTRHEVVVFPGSGRVAVESALCSVIEPGDRILTVNNGVFGHWLGLTVSQAGGTNVELAADWRRGVDPDLVREKLKEEKGIKAVAVVHNETSTGIGNPVADIGKIAKEFGALYVVDVVSSAGGDWVKMDEWNVDLACACSYKCLNCPPGLAIVGVSDAAWAALAKRKVRQSYSFDLYKYVEMWLPRDRGGKEIWGHRRHVVEPAPQLTHAMLEGLKVLMEEGLPERYRQNRVAGRAIRAAVRAMGLELYAQHEPSASNTVTAVVNPRGIAAATITQMMRRESGVIIAGALEEVAGKVLRIAHMSCTSSPMYVLHTIRALEQTLERLDHQVPRGSGAEAALVAFEAEA
ncbi:MAG: alanine--glyoxylate aminotransferase family protein [Candidatus Methylomirabilota bacterium]